MSSRSIYAFVLSITVSAAGMITYLAQDYIEHPVDLSPFNLTDFLADVAAGAIFFMLAITFLAGLNLAGFYALPWLYPFVYAAVITVYGVTGNVLDGLAMAPLLTPAFTLA
jgi:hypothetical protein